MKALIDADLILYRVGFTTQDVDSSDIVASRVDTLINETIIGSIDVDSYKLYLTGPSNYRFNIYPEYKSSRKTKEKPRHYQWIKDYLIEYYDASWEEPYEADDLLGINQTEDTIICSIDKDLLQIPGHHFNFVNGNISFVTKEDGDNFFYKQLLTGDNTDDIPGVPLICKSGISARKCFGDTTAEKYLAPHEDRYQGVLEAYKKVFKDEWEKELNLRGALLHIRQEYVTEESPIWKYEQTIQQK